MEKKECRMFRSDTAYLLYLRQQKSLPSKEEIKRQTEKKKEILLYKGACQKCGISCVSRFKHQIGSTDIDLSNSCLNKLELLAILYTIKTGHTIRDLNLSGTNMDILSSRYLSNFLKHNKTLNNLNISKCLVHGEIMKTIVAALLTSQVRTLDVGKNNIQDRDNKMVALLINHKTLKELYLSHNKLETRNTRPIEFSFASSSLEILDLSWNCIRFTGAVDISRGLMRNKSLLRLNLSWNGFGFEGCVALAEMLKSNNILTELDLTNNRIHPPALIALIRGLAQNKTLKLLNLSLNPIPASYSCILFGNILQNTSLNHLILMKMVVNEEFVELLRNVQQTRDVQVEFEKSLPVPSLDHQTMTNQVRAPWLFNLDPLALLFMLKEKNRAQDFFNKINRDGDNVLSYDEFKELFKRAGVPVSQLVLDKIIEFLDKNKDGSIDLSEFLDGDKRMKKITRGHAKENLRRESYTKYSRSFRKAKIDAKTFRLDIESNQ
uniref:EF-hand domain-containing protein n=1 Tax=Magallana gigas TaxID=29159 RepID=A0A8W8I3N3_MAGGI|nr:leucine-rich repeat-containing protein 74B [Crassostrea gigas]